MSTLTVSCCSCHRLFTTPLGSQLVTCPACGQQNQLAGGAAAASVAGTSVSPPSANADFAGAVAWMKSQADSLALELKSNAWIIEEERVAQIFAQLDQKLDDVVVALNMSAKHAMQNEALQQLLVTLFKRLIEVLDLTEGYMQAVDRHPCAANAESDLALFLDVCCCACFCHGEGALINTHHGVVNACASMRPKLANFNVQFSLNMDVTGIASLNAIKGTTVTDSGHTTRTVNEAVPQQLVMRP